MTRSDSELESTPDIVTFEVIRRAIVAIAREMSLVMEKTAYSSVFSEGLDFSCAVFDGNAQMVAQAERSPVHLAAMQHSVTASLEHVDDLSHGDVIIHNDPYLGGTHLTDVTVLSPVFVEGELAFFVANRGHHVDVGGMTPGSFNDHSRELFHEGLVIPPVKLVDRGVVNKSVYDLILRNVRLPKNTRGDLNAQIGSCNRGINRVLELVARYGLPTVRSTMEASLEYSERLMAAAIAEIPDGLYTFADRMDPDSASDVGYEIRVAIEVSGATATVDFEGSSVQSDGPINAVSTVTASAVYLEFISIFGERGALVNAGAYRPIRIQAPAGTIVNANPPAPCMCGNTETSQRIAECVRGALSEAVPDKVAAAGMGTSRQLLGSSQLGYHDDNYYIWYQYPGGGWGASVAGDGESAMVSEVSNCAATPTEVFESLYPWRIVRHELRADSGGVGKWRGGLGQVKEIEYVGDESGAKVTVAIDRVTSRPWGLESGKAGASSAYGIRRVGSKSDETPLTSRASNVPIAPGDTVVIRTPGGGGYGNPAERDPGFVERDVAYGYVSRAAAEHDYSWPSPSPGGDSRS